MPAVTAASANLAYEKAITKLSRACVALEHHIPPDGETDPPPLRPRPRSNSVAACALCAAELEELAAGDREGHICTHTGDHREDDAASIRSDGGTTQRKGRNKQPMVGVIKEYMDKVDTCLDAFTDAISVLCSVLEDREEKLQYQDHLTVWVEHCECLKDRAREAIVVLEAALERRTEQSAPGTIAGVSNTGQKSRTDIDITPTFTLTSEPAGDGTYSLAGPSNRTSVVNVVTSEPVSALQQVTTASTGTMISAPASTVAQLYVSGTTGANSLPPVSNINANVSQHQVTSYAQLPLPGWRQGPDSMYSSTNLELAVKHMNSIGNAIHEDLLVAEQEVSADGGGALTENAIDDLRTFCSTIDTKIEVNYRDAGNKAARMDLIQSTNASRVMEDNIRSYQGRVRQILADLRRARSSTPSTGSVARSTSTPPHEISATGYKPYIERIKPPVFSGRVEDWPQFRSVWKDLLSNLPDSIQVQHLKSSLPEVDQRRVTGVNTMLEIWTRLERVYGDTDLNIITVKSNLENFTPKSSQDHKRILEVFETIETAVTQLRNLDALKYLQDDFGLMSKLVLKLPIVDQRQYTQYITSASIKLDPRSRWEKFWTWMEQLHESAVQANLMHMCDKPTASKDPVSNVTKSSVTCNTCGGIGHYERSCPTKTKSGIYLRQEVGRPGFAFPSG